MPIGEDKLVELAARLAMRAHSGQMRKFDAAPYTIHPFMVALKLRKYNFPEEVIAAALAHDILEDTKIREVYLRRMLGDEVADIVNAVTYDHKLPWRLMKERYLDAIRSGPPGAKAVAVADKIHNLESILAAYSKYGSAIWEKFDGGREARLWFDGQVLAALKENWRHPLISEYERLLRIALRLK